MNEIDCWRRPPPVRRAHVDGRFGQVHYRASGTAGAGRPAAAERNMLADV